MFIFLGNSIKDNFTVPGGHLELAPEQRHDDVISFINNHFMKDEPLFATFSVEIEPYTNRLLWRLKQNISIMAVLDKSDEICVMLRERDAKRTEVDSFTLSDET